MTIEPLTIELFLCLSGVLIVSIGVVFWQASHQLGYTSGSRNRIVIGSALGIALWQIFTAILAYSGLLRATSSHPPLEPLLPVTALAILIAVSRSGGFSEIARAIPIWQPIAFQSFRIVVEYLFYRLFIEGDAPVQVTFEGRNFDIFVGFTAPFVALAVCFRWIGKRGIIAWNLLGLLVLINTIVTVITSTPGPLHLNWPGEPFVAFGTWPVIWIPSFYAPLAIFLHVLSIRQAMRLEINRAPPPFE